MWNFFLCQLNTQLTLAFARELIILLYCFSFTNLYLSYIGNMANQKRLNCIVFDEIQKLLTEISYRKCFCDFYIFNTTAVPIYGLSGSIPPTTIPALVELTGTTWRIVRTPSNRSELCYSVVHVQGDVKKQILEDIPEYTKDYGPEDRLMVFCRSRGEVESLSHSLSIPPYTSATPDENEATMAKWRSGVNKIMVSTSLLGCGLDYASIRHVLHCNIAYTMLDQHQQESRAGRDGMRAHAITYVPASGRSFKADNSKSTFGLGQLQTWAHMIDQCLRIIPSAYLDGVPVTCSLLPGCELCAFCSGELAGAPPPRVVSLARFMGEPITGSTRVDHPLNLALPQPPKTPVSPTPPAGLVTPSSEGNRTSWCVFCILSVKYNLILL